MLRFIIERSSFCGSDGKMYGSECQMKEEACRQQKEILPSDICEGIIPTNSIPAVSQPLGVVDHFWVLWLGRGPPLKLCPWRLVHYLMFIEHILRNTDVISLSIGHRAITASLQYNFQISSVYNFQISSNQNLPSPKEIIKNNQTDGFT